MLHYQSEGTGQSLVLLHAFPLSSAMWARERQELGKTMRVITPDLPGFGASQRQLKPSIQGMAEEVSSLLDHLNIREPVILGGISLGGYVAFEFLRLFPGRINGLMLFSTRAAADSPEAREKRFSTIRSIEESGFENFAREVPKNLLGKTTLKLWPAVEEKVLGMIMANKAGGIQDCLRAMAERRDSLGLLTSIHVPCLVVAGKEDGVIPPLEAQAMHKKIAGSEFHKVSKAGHLVNLESPDIFDDLLKKFLEKNILVMKS